MAQGLDVTGLFKIRNNSLKGCPGLEASGLFRISKDTYFKDCTVFKVTHLYGF